MKKCLVIAGFALVLVSSPATRADAPPGRYVVNSNGTVLDTRTNLTWQRATNSGTYTQPNAVTLCSGLTLASMTWRLPKVSELLTLIDPLRFNTSIDATAFPSTSGTQYWSSTLDVGHAGEAWFGNFYNGSSGHFATTNTQPVRCVH